MYRAHAKYFPPIPTTIQDLSFDGPLYEQYILTKKYKKCFLLFDGYQEIRDKKSIIINRERITIYCSDYGLKLLAQATKIGADGTFKTRPKIYEQLYIIMAWHKGVCQPAAFVYSVESMVIHILE